MSVCCGVTSYYLLRLPLFIVLLIIIVLIIAPGYYLRNVCTTNSLTLRNPVAEGTNPSGVRLLHCRRYSLAALGNPYECPVFVTADLHKKGVKTVQITRARSFLHDNRHTNEIPEVSFSILLRLSFTLSPQTLSGLFFRFSTASRNRVFDLSHMGF